MLTSDWMPSLAALLLVGGALVAAPPARAEGVADEYAVKAAFLVNFLEFVEWPVESSPELVDIAVVEPDPLGRALDRVAKGESALTAVSVQRLRSGEVPPQSRILFVSARSGEAGLRSLEMAHHGTLTVGETREFLERGGIIRLAVVDGHVRIEVNTAAAELAGLHVSSKLLRVAILWHPKDKT